MGSLHELKSINSHLFNEQETEKKPIINEFSFDDLPCCNALIGTAVNGTGSSNELNKGSICPVTSP